MFRFSQQCFDLLARVLKNPSCLLFRILVDTTSFGLGLLDPFGIDGFRQF
ncbi:MAG: hypothetical protein WCQ50_08115 [Spirochaetota bacterium]